MKKNDISLIIEKYYKQKKGSVSILKIPRMNFIKIDGSGDPNKAQVFKDSVTLLFTLSYTLKFMMKKEKKPVEYHVMPLEGLWWMHSMNEFSLEKKDQWLWTLMIMQPPFITKKYYTKAEEGPTMENLHTFIKENGYELHGKHHEIYFGDPRRGNPQNLKTIIRQPIVKKN